MLRIMINDESMIYIENIIYYASNDTEIGQWCKWWQHDVDDYDDDNDEHAIDDDNSDDVDIKCQ